VRDTGYGVRDTEKTAVDYVGQHEGVALHEAEAVACIMKIDMITKRNLHLQ
jgi:hypothetical protein